MAYNKHMFGITDMDAFIRSIEGSIRFGEVGPPGMIQSLLSDVQEQLVRGETDEARQALNRVKFLIDKWYNSKR